MATPVVAKPDTTRRNKYAVIAVWLGLALVVWIGPSILLNLYIFGGIDFPNGVVSKAWLIGGPILLYGSVIAAPIVAVVGVRRHNVDYPLLLAVLAVPFVLQVVFFLLYLALTDVYGAVCC